MRNPWIWRIIIVLLAVAILPKLVGATAALIMNGVDIMSQGIQSLFEPLSRSGEAKLEGILELCLYFFGITLLFRILLGGRNRDGG
jgi:hypothetical protein